MSLGTTTPSSFPEGKKTVCWSSVESTSFDTMIFLRTRLWFLLRMAWTMGSLRTSNRGIFGFGLAYDLYFGDALEGSLFVQSRALWGIVG